MRDDDGEKGGNTMEGEPAKHAGGIIGKEQKGPQGRAGGAR